VTEENHGDATASPRVVVVVVNWCGEDDTSACVQSLLDSDYPALRVLVVDNGSPDGSGERIRLRFPSADYLQTGANLGFTGGNNAGIGRAMQSDADYVLVLNNDTVVEPDAVTHLVSAARTRDGVGAVGAKILFFEDRNRIWFAGGTLSRHRAMGYHIGEGHPDTAPGGGAVAPVTFLTGCCMLLPVAVLRRVGGFEEDFFMYAEDVDLCLRIQEAGYSLFYQPRARIYHRMEGYGSPPTPFQLELAVRNRRRLARRRLSPLERLRFGLFFYPSRAARMVEFLVRRDSGRVRAVWRGMTSP
jgi:GT2 family glycosyltransferase